MAIKFQQQPKAALTSEKVVSKDLNSLLQKEIRIGKPQFTDKKKAAFYDELSVLLESGIHLKSALELLVTSEAKAFEKALLDRMLQSLVSGGSLSNCMKNESVFSQYEYIAIKIGEETGNLVEITKQLSAFYQQKVKQKSEIIGALTYPIIVLGTALVVIGFMLNFVVPLFVDIFKQNRVELPWITKSIVTASNFLKDNTTLLLVSFVILIVLSYRIRKNLAFKKMWESLLLKLPILNSYIKNVKLAQFTQAVSLMSNAKIDITKCLSMSAKMISFFPLSNALQVIEQEIINGGKLSVAFEKYDTLFDKKMIALLRVAEETNNTAYIFNKLNKQFTFEVNKQSKLIADVLNPILTIIVGLIVGVILIAMYLPMFKLSNVIG